MSKQVVHILAIESSCDDTSVAIMEASRGDDVPRLLALSLQSQNEVHERFGGVVPELASRAHLQNLIPCMSKVLTEAGLELRDIDLVAATARPGLVGCLLIGHSAAKTLSFLLDRPLISCHHIKAHLMSVHLENQIEFPYLAAVVSGGHTSLYVVRSYDDHEEVGVTLDDAMGEAFDKGAKLLGLGFPGGPEIDRLAGSGNEAAFKFGKVKVPDFNFSFSGLKSELQRTVKRHPTAKVEDLAASYQTALAEHLLGKVELALGHFKLSRFVLVGGVARNSYLRSRLDGWRSSGLIDAWYAPRLQLCTDNAAMVGVLAWRQFLNNDFSRLDADVSSTSRPQRKAS